MRPSRLVVPIAAIALAAPAAASAEIGSAGLGDPYFPNAGNGGYDVSSYDLEIAYAPRSERLDGRATIRATATVELDRFNLDLRRQLRADSVSVNGAAATARQHGRQELEITPASPIPSGDPFTVVVEYAGKPKPVKDPDGSREGWIATRDGALAPNQPQGAPSWYPCNDYPTDKATFSISLTVPEGLQAISNGRLVGRERSGGRKTWRWQEPQPMATYLATVAIGNFEITRSGEGPAPSLFAVDPAVMRKAKDPDRALRSFERTPRITRFLARRFGPYPFTTNGGILDRSKRIPYALETQTRPLYTSAPNDFLVVHEIAHQWYGNSVTLSSWPEIWLNEGLATFAEYLWSEKRGDESAAKIFDELYRTPAKDTEFWNPPPGDPGGPKHLFSDSVYIRGAMTLQALRERIGNAAFFRILRAWAAEHAYGNVTTEQFIALAERESGEQLDELFRVWLYEPGKPRDW